MICGRGLFVVVGANAIGLALCVVLWHGRSAKRPEFARETDPARRRLGHRRDVFCAVFLAPAT